MRSNEQHAENNGRANHAWSTGINPHELSRLLGDWYFAWCWRRKMRRLMTVSYTHLTLPTTPYV